MQTLSYAKPVKAKKAHSCNYCHGVIDKGETYETSTHKFDGSVYTWKAHLKCQKLAVDMNMFDDADEGVTDEIFNEYVTEKFRDIMIETNLEAFKQRDFKYPKFAERLEIVIEYLTDTPLSGV